MESSQGVESGKIHFHLRMGEELTVQVLPGIRRMLLQQLSHCKEVEVDFTRVSIVDAKSIRSILSIRREALRKGKAMRFMSRNEAFLKLMNSMDRTLPDANQAIRILTVSPDTSRLGARSRCCAVRLPMGKQPPGCIRPHSASIQ